MAESFEDAKMRAACREADETWRVMTVSQRMTLFRVMFAILRTDLFYSVPLNEALNRIHLSQD